MWNTVVDLPAVAASRLRFSIAIDTWHQRASISIGRFIDQVQGFTSGGRRNRKQPMVHFYMADATLVEVHGMRA